MKYEKEFSNFKSTQTAPNMQTAPTNSGGQIWTLIPLLLIGGALVLGGYLVTRRLPKSYDQCVNFPGSKVENGVCRTIYRATFTQQETAFEDQELEEEPGTESITTPYPTPDWILGTTPKTTPVPTSIAGGKATTKGGLPIDDEITPTPKPNNQPKPTSPPVTVAPKPATGYTGGNLEMLNTDSWYKHNFPKLNFSTYLPGGWTASANKITNTGVTTVTFYQTGGTSPIVLTIQPNWDGLEAVHDSPINYEVKNIPAIKTGPAAGRYHFYFERQTLVYHLSCQDSLANQCHTMLQKLEFTN